MANIHHNTGNAGEFYVLAQLAQRGFIAGKTDDGQTLVDVIVTSPGNLKSVNIQVKTRSGEGDGWMMSEKNEEAFDNLWYVLVQLNGTEILPDFFVFHSSAIGPWLKNDHATWLANPTRHGKPRKDTKMRRFKPQSLELAEAKGNWDSMF